MAQRNARTKRHTRLGTGAEEATSGAVDDAGLVGIVRRFFELSEDLCVVVDLDGVVRYANQAWTSLLGRDPGEVVGRHLGTFLEGNDGDRADAAARDAVQDEFLHGFEKRFVHRDGSTRWIQWSIQVDDDEKVAYGIGRDTTTRHEAEVALAASELSYRSLIDASLDGMILATAAGDVILANPAMRAMLGHPSDDLTRWNRVDVVDPNDASVHTYIEERERTGLARGELTLRRQDGTTFPANVSSAIFTDAAGQQRSSIVVRDVSTERRLRGALTGSAAKVTLQAAALEAAANAIVITDPNGTIEWVNPAFTAMTGYEQHEAIGRKPSLLKSGAHDERYYRELWETITAGRPWHGELTNRRKDGSLYQEELTITPVRDGTATISHYIAIKQDVTARRASEQALRESEDSFRKLFERNPFPMYVYDATTFAFLAVNDAMVGLYGYSEDEFLAMDLTDIRPAEDRPRLLTYLENRPDHRDGNEGVWVHTLKDGTAIDVDITTYSLTFRGTPARLVVAQDITASLKAQRDLLASEERYRMLADNAVDVVFRFRVHPDLGFDYVSPAAFALTGYTPEEHYANPDLFYSVFHPDDRLDLMQTTLQGRPMLSTARFTHRDGSIVHTEQHSRPIYDDNGNLVAVEGIVRDITERARAQQRVDGLNRRLERQLSRFEAIHHLDAAILLDAPISSIVETVLDALTNELHIDGVAVFRLDDSHRQLRLVGSRHIADTALTIPIGRGMAGEAARTRKPVTVHDTRTETENDTTYLRKIDMRGCLAVSLTSATRLEGALELFTREPLDLDHEARVFAEAMAHQLSLAFQREGLLSDIHTANLDLDEALTASRTLINSLPANIAVLDHEGTVVDVNERWRAYGAANGSRDPSYGIGSNYLAICEVAAKDEPEIMAIRNGIHEVLTEDADSFSVEYPCPGSAGARWYRLVTNATRNPGPEGVGAVVMHLDVTEEREARDRLAKMAFTDSLTGLANRNGFIREIDTFIQSNGWPENGVVLLMDIDGFQSVNDAHGFAGGDAVLQSIASRLRDHLSADAILSRADGDTFAAFILLDQPRDGHPDAMIARVEEAVSATPYLVEGAPLALSFHIGITHLASDERQATDLLREAELALYSIAKDPVIHDAYYTSDLDQRTRERTQLTKELRTALENDEFQLHYQPKVDLTTDSLTAAEALIRWNHPQRGLLAPGTFIAAAEQSGLITPIGTWVLNEACAALRRWQDEGLDIVRIAVNVSVEQFRTGTLVTEVRNAIERHGISPASLTLEVTESVFVTEVSVLRSQLDELHDLGIHLALDDFGKGYSSLSYLKNFHFDALKIDYAFIKDMLTDDYSHTVVQTSIQLATSLGAEAIAEGIETLAQRDELIALRCPQGQGFYFSIPLQEEDFRWLLQEHTTLPIPESR